MSRLSDIIPSLYYNNENNLIDFVNALDVEVSGLEKQVKGITDLINVDKCPDDKLPYLAAFTNCPLIGDDPVFWRKQIKNWPYILKLKGTEKSLELVLNSVNNIDSWKINTYFRDAKNRYVTEKPEGQPFKDGNGIWRNIRTHYFGIDLTLSKDFVQSKNYDWKDNEFKKKLSFWLDRGKPYHSELLRLLVLPPNPLPDDHICYWDYCDWEHVERQIFDWGMLDLPVFENDPVAGFTIYRDFKVIDDIQSWDISTWGATPYRFLQFGLDFQRDIFVELDREKTATWYIPYSWGDFTWADAERYSRDFGLKLQRDFNLDFNIQAMPFGSTIFIGMVADLQPYWDFYTWTQHDTWGDDFGVPYFAPGFKRDCKASVQWDKHEAPLPKWSQYKTWAGSDTWESLSTITGTWETGTWTDFEEEIA